VHIPEDSYQYELDFTVRDYECDFNQDIFKMPENKLVSRAKVIGVGVQRGRPIRLEDVPGFNELV